MKQIIFMAALILATPLVFAQKGETKSDKLQALRVAHITEQIELTSDEAQSFWPLYNDINESRRTAEHKKRKLIKEIERNYTDLEESEAQQHVEELRKLEAIIGASHFSEKHREIIDIIGAKRFLKLQKAEMDFRREMIKKFKERRRR